MVEMVQDERFAVEKQYYYKEVMITSGNGEAIRIAGGDIHAITYQLDGNGTLQATAYPVSCILDNTAVWVDVPEDNYLNPAITAVRQVNVSGTTTLNVRCQ